MPVLGVWALSSGVIFKLYSVESLSGTSRALSGPPTYISIREVPCLFIFLGFIESFF